jgi:hypothetical protein
MRTKTMLIAMSLLLAGTTPGFAAPQTPATSAALQSQSNPIDSKTAELRAMVGKSVLGKSREFLGTLISVDGEKRTADMKVPTGAVLTLATEKLSVEEDHVRAATISRGDVLVMVRQSGQAGTLEAGVLPGTPNLFKKK